MPSTDNRQRYDLQIYRGADFIKDAWFKIRNPQTGELGPYDLTGFTAKAQIRPSENSRFLTQDIRCDITPAEGRLQLSILCTDTEKIPPGIYVWDLKLDQESGVSYYVYGKVFVEGRVTE